MQLDKRWSKVTIEEQVDYEMSMTEPTREATRYWVARLAGVTPDDGMVVNMDRHGETPDAAIKALFEAMGEAGVTL